MREIISWADQLRKSRENNPKAQTQDDEHRKSAYGRFDSQLEKEEITPEQAQRKKETWDANHGY
jgi:hypothetical protein